ncbi:hydantoinase/oxoprolinase family protein [Thiohalobacter sp. IOR34]|uniref:hydantoinase/oxoprolinase family protein n=1 Tax=Thiohalobacter sp. IOR34 TaxID=3057176 RepID=UPI0025B134A1|nr:hydantoinase/oxoprolinase family protein [Thiohalobacter sp. IOR34]WJW75760.1 hydantoinase/oxoprolinase family protein [Thiohalobacter sp. IOR34]
MDGCLLLGVDTGGTFTDFVLFDGRSLRVHKVLSTPDAPERAILQGIHELGLEPQSLRLVHGSTVATNAVLEGKGVRTLYIGNRGLADLLAIGRQARPALYALQPVPPEPPLPPELCLECSGRLGADGRMLEPLDEAELQDLVARVRALQPQAVAINLLFSFLDDSAERRIEAALPEGLFVSRSSAVLPEYREYERGMATFLNAYVGPLVQGYLQRLQTGLAPAPVAVMQSSGETLDAAAAGRQAVRLLLSGPAGGLSGARFVGAEAGCPRLLTFDMGGTSTDVALIDGEPALTSEGRIGRWPVAVPMVDMHTIGAGGGSIARVDAGGLLQVGPESAGADPGPACYGRGGVEPTVTDANLVLGRLRPEAFLGGSMRLDVEAARRALQRIASPLGLSVEAAAEGVLRIANEHMVRALRVISVERGLDPADFVLTSFGGAGGLHVCALAEALGVRRALVPVHGGVLSALGMLAAPRGRQLSRTLARPLADCDPRHLQAQFAALIEQGSSALAAEGLAPEALQVERSLDLRYVGQSYTLNLPWQADPARLAEAFHAAHAVRYGHRLEAPVELVNLRVGLRGPRPGLRLGAPAVEMARPVRASLHGIGGEVPVWPRATLAPGERLEGPALITESVSTTLLAPGWRAEVDAVGNLLLSR